MKSAPRTRVWSYLEQLKAGRGRPMGFGHRVYNNYDPRARTIKWTADQVFEVTGRDPKLEIALEFQRIALDDEYFIKRKLYPNVDFYSGIIYQAMGFQPECSRCCLRFRAPSAGWPSGRRCSRVRSRRLRAPGRSISETRRESLCRLSVGGCCLRRPACKWQALA